MKQPYHFIDEARDTVQQRGTDNGYDAGQERSAAKVAAVFNALTGRDLTEQDVWTLLLCLKLVRNQRKYKPDNIVDMIGYAALLGEHLDAGLKQQIIDASESLDNVPQQVESLAVQSNTSLVSGVPLEKATGEDLDRWAKLLGLQRGKGINTSTLEGDEWLRQRCLGQLKLAERRRAQRFG